MDDFKKAQIARHNQGYPFKTGSQYSLSRKFLRANGKGKIRPEFNRMVKRSLRNLLKNELQYND